MGGETREIPFEIKRKRARERKNKIFCGDEGSM